MYSYMDARHLLTYIVPGGVGTISGSGPKPEARKKSARPIGKIGPISEKCMLNKFSGCEIL